MPERLTKFPVCSPGENSFVFDDSTTRFSRRVNNYVRFRPGYPAALVDLLARHAGLTAASTIADIGSGTGLLSRPFLDADYAVIGVEPNREMREAGDALLASYPRFRGIQGTAEATTLSDHSVDLVIAGQAFHWFDVEKTRREWTRILRTGGVAALIWNERCMEGAFMRDVEAVIDIYAAEMDRDGAIRESGRSRIPGFFAPSTFELNEFPNKQQFGLEGLLGRVASCSFLPDEQDPRFEKMSSDLARVFERHQVAGTVRFEYRTKVYWGRL
jgi:SAM-dependent methyltransferase